VFLEGSLDGQAISILRRKKGSSTDIYLNEKKATQGALAEIYRDKAVFLSIFNPYYFPSLSPKDAKALLSDVLKPVPKEEVFEELGSYLTGILEKNKFRIPENFLSDKNAEIKEQKENIVFLEGVIEGSKIQEVPENKNFDNTELEQLEDELLKLHSSINDTAIKELQNKITVTKGIIARGTEKKHLLDVKSLEYTRNSLLNQYKSIKTKIDNFKIEAVKCPNCETIISDNSKEIEKLKAQSTSIVKNGKDIAAQITEIEGNNDAIKLENERLAKQFSETYSKELERLEGELLKAKETFEAENKSKETKILELKEKIGELKAKEREVLQHNAGIDSIIKKNAETEKEVEKAKERIKNSNNKISELKLAIDAGKQFNSIRLNKQTETINKYLDKVELSFEELGKDGELKEKFKILYEGKEFTKLSTSERIKAGLEISNLISNVMDLKIPVFVDDSESITRVPVLDTQMILTKVVEGLEEIKVEVIE
jgi:DNA repair exonuclease SbcCD ATPase subunit